MRLDDDAYLDTSPSHSIGEIKLVIYRTSHTHRVIAKPPPREPLPMHKVHERSKKAIAHRVK